MKINIHNHAFTALSAVNPDSVQDFIQTLVAITMSYDFEYDSVLRGKTVAWAEGSKDFVRRFKLDGRKFRAIVKGVSDAKNPNEDDGLDAKIQEFLVEVRKATKEVQGELDVSTQSVRLLRDLVSAGLHTTKDSTRDNALARIDKAIGQTHEPSLIELFTEEMSEQESQSDVLDELRQLTAKMIGKPKTNLSAPEKKKYQEYKRKKGVQHPDYDRFLVLRREVNRVYKQHLKALVRNAPDHLVSVSDAIHHFNQAGVEHNLPDGFVGKVDENGGLYTSAGEKLGSVPMGQVTMNPRYDKKADDTFYLTVRTDAGNLQRIYTDGYRKGKTTKKFDVVGKFIPAMKKVRGAWRKLLPSGYKTVDGVAATLAELVYISSARVGSERGQTDGEQTFGITTVRVRHLSWKGSVLHIKYKGKKGGVQHHIIRPEDTASKHVLTNIKRLCRDKGKDDKVFVVGRKALTGGTINKLLKTLGVPAGFTVHKLRTARATILAKDLLSTYKGDLTGAALNKWVIEKMKEVGLELGHFSGEKVTANTAITHYIDPSVFAEFYTKHKVRPPAAIDKAIAKVK